MNTPITDAEEITACHVDGAGGGWLKVVPSKVSHKLESDLNTLTAIHKKLCHAVKNASYKSITLDQQKWHMAINDILGESARNHL